jgi:thiol-disulfide isomerase/thioredoxin
MDKRIKLIILITVFALLLIAATIGYSFLSKQYKPENNVSVSNSQSSRQAAPDFTVKDANGNDVKLSDFKGKPVVLNFWASWCPPCRSEMPDYNTIYQKYSDKGVVFLMVNMTDGQRETIDIAKKFVKDNNYKFSVYFDVNSDAANNYGISSIPDSLFIDKNGNIVNSYVGAIDEATIQSNIETLLK